MLKLCRVDDHNDRQYIDMPNTSKIIRISFSQSHYDSWKELLVDCPFSKIYKLYSYQNANEENATLKETFLINRSFTNKENIEQCAQILKKHNIKIHYEPLIKLGPTAYLIIFMNEGIDINSAIAFGQKIYCYVK